MQTVDLSDSPSYTALSYEWGTEDDLQTIHVNGHAVKIRYNLFDFFKTHRHTCDGRSLWVDQICIDQSKIAERNHQVGIMEDVYRGAQETLCWLGQDPEEGVAFSTIAKLLDQKQTEDQKEGTRSLTLAVRWKRLSMPQTHAFRTMARSSYWSRHWIAQELLLSARPTLAYGSSTMPFSDLVDVSSNFPCFGGREYQDWERDGPLQHILRTADKGERQSDFWLWRSAATIAKHTSCLDSRDKIYGIQSLFPLKMRIPVDYSTTAASVYVEMLALWYKRSQHNNGNLAGACEDFRVAMGISFEQVCMLLRGYISFPMKPNDDINLEVNYQEILSYLDYYTFPPPFRKSRR